MKNLLLFLVLFASTFSYSQSQNWWKIDGSNTANSSSAIGTSNFQPLRFKANGNEWLTISPTGAYTFSSLNSATKGVLGVDQNGLLFRTDFTGNSFDVLSGTGDFVNIGSLSGWILDGNNLFTNYNVGIGTNIAPEKLTVNGNILANGSISGTSLNVVDIVGAGKEFKISTSLCMKGIDVNTPGSRNEICGLNGDLFIQSMNNNYNTILNYGNNGKVGIGILPTEGFHVGVKSRFDMPITLTNINPSTDAIGLLTLDGDGNLELGDLNEFAGNLYNLECWVDPNIGYITPFWHNGAYKVYVGGNSCEQDIKVGINTANPTSNLHVIGDGHITGTLRIGTSSIWLGGVDQTTGSNNTIFATSDLLIQSDATNPYNTILNANNTGNVGIGLTNPANKLEVAGTVRACKFIAEANSWCDFVFAEGYQLMSIAEMEQYLKTEKHLKYIPSENEIYEKGVDLVQVYTGLLRHTEENSLYIIHLEKENAELEKRIEELEKEKVENEEWKRAVEEKIKKLNK